jgi:hypothetical protein
VQGSSRAPLAGSLTWPLSGRDCGIWDQYKSWIQGAVLLRGLSWPTNLPEPLFTGQEDGTKKQSLPWGHWRGLLGRELVLRAGRPGGYWEPMEAEGPGTGVSNR